MNKNLLKLAASKAARMLGLGALLMSFGALSLTSCDDDDDNSARPGDGQKVAAILKDNTPYWQGVARGVEAERVESYKSVLPVAMEETLTKANK